MDVSIKLDNPDSTLTSGETVFGSVIIYCPKTITVSKITASLIGESTSILNAKMGLLMNWKEQERHRFVHESQIVVPYHYGMDDSTQEPLRLGFGYHSFSFGLKVPLNPACCICPPNSPEPQYEYGNEKRDYRLSQDLPPPMMDLVKGAEVSYRIDVAVTTMRNMFNSTVRKSTDIDIWPIDTIPHSIATMPPYTILSTKSIQASILGPPTLLSPKGTPEEVYLISTVDTPARILITTSFLPDFNLIRQHGIALHLTVKKLHPYPYEVYLQSFQMLLMGYTDIRAGSATSGQMSCWTIRSLSNLGMRMFTGQEEAGMEYVVDPALWEGKGVPGDAIPTFQACNLARRYELEILLGFQCRGSKNQAGRMLFVQLRVPVRISSGVRPDQRVNEAARKETRVELSPGFENAVANWFEYNHLLGQNDGRRHLSQEYPTPPTYEEATTGAVKRESRVEKWFSYEA